ncbi:cell division protein ZipA C-terminal FtsZ-binding domain-containing protein [Thiomicrospira sp. ALE5]|uniref:cell division protein ZipA C-terminal FtsZ-binding domain-containing protein n=1 Tax=Thiomicrospira sp. ALE5 TaxID=748650 RepID=UPI0008E4B0D0|nr:cell division protein ZipA C-terminal FtsZ-binding domain-containing protein [Thiomicrospira sp. ALE5]SFR50309.1 cell division protein ZipA [Thiomicrospira sp. ALE5]
MNEMQWILLAFAVVVVIAIYVVSQKRSFRQSKPQEQATNANAVAKKRWAKVGLGAKEDVAIPSMKPNSDLHTESNSTDNRDQPITEQPIDTSDKHDAFDYLQAKLELEAEMERKQDLAASTYASQTPSDEAKHKVLEIDDMYPADNTFYAAETRDGRSESMSAASQLEVPLDNSEPENFAILVLSIADEFSLKAIDQVLRTNGLTFNGEAGIFVKRVNDKTVLRVANIFEPGVFPAEWEEGASTAGIAIILQLPTHIKAPRAMDELILTARRVSQSLRGRMYDMERRMIRETDLQAMRERALDYETKRM